MQANSGDSDGRVKLCGAVQLCALLTGQSRLLLMLALLQRLWSHFFPHASFASEPFSLKKMFMSLTTMAAFMDSCQGIGMEDKLTSCVLL